MNNSIERDIYIDRISKKYTISKSAIINEINKIGKKSQVNIDVMDLNQAITKKEKETMLHLKRTYELVGSLNHNDIKAIRIIQSKKREEKGIERE